PNPPGTLPVGAPLPTARLARATARGLPDTRHPRSRVYSSALAHRVAPRAWLRPGTVVMHNFGRFGVRGGGRLRCRPRGCVVCFRRIAVRHEPQPSAVRVVVD